jgi:hypothetical protein
MDLGFDQPVAMNQGEEDSDDEFRCGHDRMVVAISAYHH